jgi:hypothetical protein
MMDSISLAVSALALAVSLATAWLTFFFRGVVRMTAPSMVVFAYDRRGSTDEYDAKVMVRSLLFSTGERGRVIEAMFAYVRCGAVEHIFPVWGYDADNKLVRGGGLFIGKTGVAAWHHFVAAGEGRGFCFGHGPYQIDVCARIHGLRSPVTLWSAVLSLPEEVTPTRHDGREQVWFDRNPATDELRPRLESLRSACPSPSPFAEMFAR